MGLRPEGWPTVLSREEAWKILSPWKADIVDPFLNGWRCFWKWKDLDTDYYATIVPRTRASIIHDYAVRLAKERFGNCEGKGVRTRTEFESLLLIFGEDLVLSTGPRK